jgi:hypothetical protein
MKLPPKIVVTSLNSHPHQPTHSLILDLRRTILRSLQKLGNTQASCYLTNKMMFFGGTWGFNCWLLSTLTFVFRSYHPSKPIYILGPLSLSMRYAGSEAASTRQLDGSHSITHNYSSLQPTKSFCWKFHNSCIITFCSYIFLTPPRAILLSPLVPKLQFMLTRIRISQFVFKNSYMNVTLASSYTNDSCLLELEFHNSF